MTTLKDILKVLAPTEQVCLMDYSSEETLKYALRGSFDEYPITFAKYLDCEVGLVCPGTMNGADVLYIMIYTEDTDEE